MNRRQGVSEKNEMRKRRQDVFPVCFFYHVNEGALFRPQGFFEKESARMMMKMRCSAKIMPLQCRNDTKMNSKEFNSDPLAPRGCERIMKIL